jgi:SAM-dependent methyltransferase
MSALPVNLAKQNSSPEAIANAVDYAISVADGFEMWLRNCGPAERRAAARPFADLKVLEVGPGQTLGSAVLLACAGARVTVADRFLARWDSDFHPAFYRALREKVRGRGDEYVAAIDRLLAADAFTPEVIRCHARGCEELWKIGARFDVVFSNAVLEHVEDLEATVRNLAAVTVRGGHGFHQVDFRDHRDFSRPLEYLTISRDDYQTVRHEAFCEWGCQWRVSTVSNAFAAAGFTQTAYPNLFADPAYLDDLRPRLHDDFRTVSEADLAATSAFFAVTRV